MDNPETAQGVEQVEAMIQQVEHELYVVEDMLEQLERQRRPLLQEKVRVEARLKLLKELLNTYQAVPAEECEGVEAEAPEMMRSMVHAGLYGMASKTPVSERIRAQVRQILEEAGEPVHINQIAATFAERGWAIPGQGLPGNITAHLTRATDIRSPLRGYYEIGPNDPSERPVRSKTRTRKRK